MNVLVLYGVGRRGQRCDVRHLARIGGIRVGIVDIRPRLGFPHGEHYVTNIPHRRSWEIVRPVNEVVY